MGISDSAVRRLAAESLDAQRRGARMSVSAGKLSYFALCFFLVFEFLLLSYFQ